MTSTMADFYGLNFTKGKDLQMEKALEILKMSKGG